MNSRFLSVVLAGLCLGVAARADTISYFNSIPTTAVSSSPVVTELDLPAFNAALGTLTGVKLSFATEFWQTAQAENLANSAANYSFTGTTTLSLDRMGGAVVQ